VAKTKPRMKTFLTTVGVLSVTALFAWGCSEVARSGGGHSPPAMSSNASTPSSSTLSPDDPQRLNPSSYSAVTLRDYALLIKDPDAHIGEKIIIYGAVEQFDSSTGNSKFRATTFAYPHPPTDADEYNALIEATSDPSILANVLTGDSIRMYVVVDGTETYANALGADLTVPKFSVNIINVMFSPH
jgi:hypothetical protein